MKLYLCIFVAYIHVLTYTMHDNFTIHQGTTAHDKSTVYLFAHGFGATHQQGLRLFSRDYCHQRWLMDYPIALFDFPDAKNDNNDYLRKYVNLGQEKDIERLRLAYTKTVELFPNHAIILVGISRGATTIINFVACYHPENVKALVLESPFDLLSSVIKHLLGRFHISWLPFAKKISTTLCQHYFPAINLNGVFPLATVDKIPANMPIIFIHSQKDSVIPITSSQRLYNKLKQTGHDHVYILELASGDHGKLIQGSDGNSYLYAVHAFYKKYGYAHDHDFAQKGAYLLAYCQPSSNEIKNRISIKKSIDNFIENNE